MKATGHQVAQRGRTHSNKRETVVTVELCQRCGFHPVSPRIGGYCSWDCHDADDEEDGAGERAA